MKIIAPLYVTIPRKTKKDKIIPMNMNWYRNAYYHENNIVKWIFKELVQDQLEWQKVGNQYWLCMTIYYKYLADLWNIDAVIDKFLNDALVETWCVIDDNMKYYIEKHVKVWWKDFKNPRVEITII